MNPILAEALAQMMLDAVDKAEGHRRESSSDAMQCIGNILKFRVPQIAE